MDHDQLANPPWWALVIFFAALLPLLFLLRRRNPREIAQLFESDVLTRLVGLCLVAVGSGIFLVFNYHPLLQAIRGDARIPHVRGSVFLSVLSIALGLLMFLAGSKCRHLLPLPDQPRTRLKLFTVLAVVALGLTGEVGLYWFLVSRGYGQ